MVSEISRRTTTASIRHTLSAASFLELSRGGGAPDLVQQLWNSEYSRRLIMLRAFHDEVAGDATLFGCLSAVRDSWEALERAQEAAPARVGALIMHPQVGAWLAYALRRRRGGADSDAPMHMDFGQFNVLALAAATLASQRFVARIPLRAARRRILCVGGYCGDRNQR